jgi:Cu-Zn family superoxide dismutase
MLLARLQVAYSTEDTTMIATSISPTKQDSKAFRLLVMSMAAFALFIAGCDVSRDDQPEQSEIVVLDQNAADGLPTDENRDLAEPSEPPFPDETTPGQRTPTEPAPGTETSVEPLGDSAADGAAIAMISPVGDGSVRGEIKFSSEASAVQISGQLSGLEPGKHGFHIHEAGQCGAEGDASGGHLSPDDDPHGSPQDEAGEHHLGDFGNIVANEDGTAEINLQDSEIRLARTGPDAIIGKALIVHMDEDDLTSQPSGQSGEPVGCGIIEQERLGQAGPGRG